MNRPLRFCMITTFYPPYHFGGDAVYVQWLSHELARRGHQVQVVHCQDSYRLLAHHEPASAYDDSPNLTVHGLASPFGALSPLVTQQTGAPHLKKKNLTRVLAQEFDVIHYHNISLVGGPKILEYGRGLKLYTTHEFWLVCPTHTLFRYDREVCSKPHCLTCTLSYGRPPQWWRYTRRLSSATRHVDLFLSPSRFGIEQHRVRGFDAPMEYLPNFVPPLFTPDTPPVGRISDAARGDATLPFFLYAGRLEKLKGVQTLIPAFQKYPRARLVIAGTGSQEQKLRTLAAEYPRIEFVGRLPPAQLQTLYRNAVAVIVPSLCYEIAPLVILEAFRSGTPVLARNRGGMIEMIEGSGGGGVFQTENELIGMMDRLLDDCAWRDEIGARGLAAYVKTYTPEAHLTRYFELIEMAAECKRARNP